MSDMLKNTLILPEGDSALAAKLLGEAIADLDVILMLILGKGEKFEQIVRWADQLCNKTRVSDAYNMRRVVWIRDASADEVKSVLEPILAGKSPAVAVLNFYDKLVESLLDIEKLNPLKLEIAFSKGHKT